MSVAAPRFSYISTTAKSTTNSSRSSDRSPIIYGVLACYVWAGKWKKEVLQHNNAGNDPDFEATCTYGGFKMLKWKLLCVQMD